MALLRSLARIPFPLLIAILSVVVACVAAIRPALHLGATYDEGVHIAAGLQWWREHRYSYEPVTPPLARAAVSFLPWLWDVRSQGMAGLWDEGRAVLSGSGDPGLVLLLGRLGTLPFLIWSSVVVWFLARRTAGQATAAVAVLCFVTLPPILGNAGVAATDMALAATFSTVIYLLMRYLDHPSRRRAVALGVSGGLVLLTKFTSITLFLGCLAGLLIWRRIAGGSERTWWPGTVAIKRCFTIATPIICMVIWAGYCFRFGSLLWHSPVDGTAGGAAGRGWLFEIASLNIFPAPEFWRGLFDAVMRNSIRFPDYYLGRMLEDETVFFFPVALLLKTPIHFLALVAIGLVTSVKRTWPTRNSEIAAPGVLGLCVIATAMLTVPHLGTRFLLPAYVFFSVTAASAVVALWNAPQFTIAARAAVVAAALWAGTIVITSRNEYLGWFNALAEPDPTYFEFSNDADWGQYGVFLAEALRQRGVTEVAIMLAWYPRVNEMDFGRYHDHAELVRLGMPKMAPLPANAPTTGWVAISVDNLRTPGYRWLEQYAPELVISHAIYVYHIE